MHPPQMIDVAYCFDKNYQQHFGASVTSLVLNRDRDRSNLRIHIVTDECDQNFLSKINYINKAHKVQINVLLMDESQKLRLEKIHHETNKSTWLEKSTWYRMLLPDILPPDIEKVLYLDADTIILSDITALFELDLNNAPVSGCLDFHNQKMAEKLNLPHYINAGVLLLDLKQWRKIGYAQACLNWAAEKKDEHFHSDQCAINTFFNSKIHILPPMWNQFMVDPPILSTPFNKQGILHFISSEKPWQSWYDNPSSAYYWKYLQASPWAQSTPEAPKTLNQSLRLARLCVKHGKTTESIRVYEEIIQALRNKL